MSRARLGSCHRGFTLVELLVVIGVIAILLALLMPALNRARRHSLQVVCMSNLRQIGAAFVIYTMANKDWLPASSCGGAEWYHDWIYYQPSRDLSQSRVAPYLGKTNGGYGQGRGSLETILRCPADDVSVRTRGGGVYGYRYSYVVNVRTNSGIDMQWMPSEVVPKLSRIHNPSHKVLLYEEDEVTADDGHGDPKFPGTTNLLGIRHDSKKSDSDLTGGTYNLMPNAERRGNACFCDGSVRYVSRSEMHSAYVAMPKMR
jgi:prepilin-type N-terminal cleavage/methylation domain-containing protein/prepilin-type processing-associated H-X9-DG protein